MIAKNVVEQQLKHIHFNQLSWGKAEARELPHILLPDETIYECVNGIYEGGFALLVATNFRVLLIDKKPLNYLTVEDLRFDMINEIDYSHRLMGAHISISTGSKNLKFRSYNQPRLRKLISHVQHCMAETKKKQSEHEEDQNSHLEQINQQLQAYLLAQYQQQQALRDQLEQAQSKGVKIDTSSTEPLKPSPELSDYLFAQSLLAQHRQQQAEQGIAPVQVPIPLVAPVQQVSLPPTNTPTPSPIGSQTDELYAEGMQEIFGRNTQQAVMPAQPVQQLDIPYEPLLAANALPQTRTNPLEINALRIAYSKLPMALRNRKFGRPSFHAHSQANSVTPQQIAPAS